MADDLDDGEFWLPSHFLTDDDILMDLDLSSIAPSTETDTDEDDSLSALLPPMARPEPDSKGWVLSTSPQSTLCGFAGKEGSSRGSPSGPVSPPLVVAKDGGATWDLLHKAAGEVARIKLTTERPTSVGTGFFDCSTKNFLCPPPRTTGFFQPQHKFPPLPHMGKPQFNRLPRNNCNNNNNNNNNNNSNRPLGLPPSAWPPLGAQNKPIQPAVPPVLMGHPGPRRESVGTGVFLPRRVTSTPETRKKSEGYPTKMKSGKGSKSQHRRSSRPPTANKLDIQLPQEWTY